MTCSFFEGLTLRVIGDVAFGMDLSDPEAETSRQFYKEANKVVHIEKMITPYVVFWIFFAGKLPDTFYIVTCFDIINSCPPGKNGRHFADDILRCIFGNEKFFYFD